MISSRLMSILLGPVVSEKTFSPESNLLVLKVTPDATKPEIKKAVETFLNLEVESVNTLNVLGKKRRTVRGMGVRSNWKKAYVTLKKGQNLEKLDLELQAADKESK